MNTAQSAKARPQIIDLLRHQFSGWSESEEGSISSARSVDTSTAMDTDAQAHHLQPQQQQKQQSEQPLRQPSYATPFANDSLQVSQAQIVNPGCCQDEGLAIVGIKTSYTRNGYAGDMTARIGTDQTQVSPRSQLGDMFDPLHIILSSGVTFVRRRRQ